MIIIESAYHREEPARAFVDVGRPETVLYGERELRALLGGKPEESPPRCPSINSYHFMNKNGYKGRSSKQKEVINLKRSA